jgi:hypothetical protein
MKKRSFLHNTQIAFNSKSKAKYNQIKSYQIIINLKTKFKKNVHVCTGRIVSNTSDNENLEK